MSASSEDDLRRILVVDTETTGLFKPQQIATMTDPGIDIPDIVSIAWKFGDGSGEQYHVVRTLKPMDPKSVQIHKLTPEHVKKHGEDPKDVLRAFMQAVRRA